MKQLYTALALVAALLVGALAHNFAPISDANAQPRGVLIYSETYDAASTVDAAGVTNAISAPAAVLGDFCIASLSVDAVDATITCNIVSAGSAEVRFQNESGSTIDYASATWRVMVFPTGTR